MLMEVVLRTFYPQISDQEAMFQDDEVLGWTFIPDKAGAIFYANEASHFIKTNASGFRDDDFEREKKGKRIMFIGDSFVSNISVKDDDVFTEVMEANVPGLDAMNFGVNGYGQVQEMLLLGQWVDQVKPDLVVLTVYVRNDFGDNMGKGQWNRKKPIALWDEEHQEVRLSTLSDNPRGKKSERYFYHKSHLYHFIVRRIANMRNSEVDFQGERYMPLAPPELILCKKEPNQQMMEMRLVMEHLILQMRNKLKEQNIPMALMIAPSIAQVEDKFWEYFISTSVTDPELFDRREPNRWLEQWGEHEHIPTLDLFSILHQKTLNGSTMYNLNEQHWTKEGNAVVAKALEDFIKLRFDSFFEN